MVDNVLNSRLSLRLVNKFHLFCEKHNLLQHYKQLATRFTPKPAQVFKFFFNIQFNIKLYCVSKSLQYIK
jgi:hypothetical protein